MVLHHKEERDIRLNVTRLKRVERMKISKVHNFVTLMTMIVKSLEECRRGFDHVVMTIQHAPFRIRFGLDKNAEKRFFDRVSFKPELGCIVQTLLVLAHKTLFRVRFLFNVSLERLNDARNLC